MKKMILAIVALMMSATMMAQEGEKQMPKKKPADKTEMVKQRTDMMVERYGLDEKQAEKLLTLNTEFADKMGHGMHMGRPGKMMGGRPAECKRGNLMQLVHVSKKNCIFAFCPEKRFCCFFIVLQQ